MIYIGSWLLTFTLYTRITSITPAVPIDIVTEKVQGKYVLKRPPIALMIPDLEPLFRRQQYTKTTIPLQLYLKYHASQYVQDYDIPFIQPMRPKFKPPDIRHGHQVFQGQMLPLMKKIMLGNGYRPPHPYGTFTPPDLIHIQNWNYDFRAVRITKRPLLHG